MAAAMESFVGIALSRGGIEVALLRKERVGPGLPEPFAGALSGAWRADRLSFPARFALLAGEGSDRPGDEPVLEFARGGAPEDRGAFDLADVFRHVRATPAVARFVEGLLERVFLELAFAAEPIEPRRTGAAVALDPGAPALLLPIVRGVLERLSFPRARAILVHEAIAGARALARPEARSVLLASVAGRWILIEKTLDAGQARFLCAPAGIAGAPEGDPVERVETGDALPDAAVGAAVLVAAGIAPIERLWHWSFGFGEGPAHSVRVAPVEGPDRELALLPFRIDRAAFDPTLVLHATLSPGDTQEGMACGSQSLNKWLLEDNGGRFVAFLERGPGAGLRWGHYLPRTGEWTAAAVPAEVLAS
ncbi:MAG: hypothetical protein HY720_18245 [Planctomycetes bacterium]|nr:hypothetical protein [Planctomycetota bacterium]